MTILQVNRTRDTVKLRGCLYLRAMQPRANAWNWAMISVSFMSRSSSRCASTPARKKILLWPMRYRLASRSSASICTTPQQSVRQKRYGKTSRVAAAVTTVRQNTVCCCHFYLHTYEFGAKHNLSRMERYNLQNFIKRIIYCSSLAIFALNRSCLYQFVMPEITSLSETLSYFTRVTDLTYRQL